MTKNSGFDFFEIMLEAHRRGIEYAIDLSIRTGVPLVVEKKGKIIDERVQPFQEIAAHLYDQHARRVIPVDVAGGKQIGELFADRRVDFRLFRGGQAWARRHGPDPAFWRRRSLGGADDAGNWAGSFDARGRRDATAPGGLGPEETARPRDGLYARHDIWRANRRHAGASSNPDSGVARLRERLGGGFARASQSGTRIGVDFRNPVARRRGRNDAPRRISSIFRTKYC